MLFRFDELKDYKNLCFRDGDGISEPLQYITKARGKRVDQKALAALITKQTQSSNVGELRALTDHDWIQAREIPAMCRVHLKHMVRQSARTGGRSSLADHQADQEFLEELQRDFNFGQPLDLPLYRTSIDHLRSMGFAFQDVMEALMITENKMESALEVLFIKDPTIRKRRRAEAVGRLNRRRPAVADGGPVSVMDALQKQIVEEKQKRVLVESQMEKCLSRVNFEAYKGFLRGLLAEEKVTPVHELHLANYRRAKQITDQEHAHVLTALGLTPEAFDKLRAQASGGLGECVVCLENTVSHVMLDCMHLCICQDCATQHYSQASTCPVCSVPTRTARRVFMG